MATNHYNKSRKSKSEPIEMQLLTAVLRGLWWVVSLPFKGIGGSGSGKRLRKSGAVNLQEVAQQWTDIQTTVGLGGTSHFAQGVVAADKLLDHVLKQKGYQGETMGERLKSAQDDMSAAVYHNAWQAHKLRNHLVHEVGSQVMSFQVKEAIQQYEAALRELGVLR
jgi:hypothetical protein